MFVSDRFVYLELHKTGCSHIRNILMRILDGECVGKHNLAPPGFCRGDRIFLGSVRNPWAWYNSLWAFGCDQKGAVFGRVTARGGSLRGLGWTKNPVAAFLKAVAVCSGKPNAWKATYTHPGDAGAFRQWLRMMQDEKTRTDIGEHYAYSPVSRVAGLMTFRYLKLFCTKEDSSDRFPTLSTWEKIREYERENLLIHHFIRTETLETDLFRCLRNHGVEISDSTQSAIRSMPRTNSSPKRRGVEFYYDRESVDLVAERERLIIEKFGYTAPPVDTGTREAGAAG